MDVHLTKDNQWIVVHDFNINGKVVEETNYDQIIDSIPDGNKPPLLDEVLLIEGLILNIELKVPTNYDDPTFLGRELQKYLMDRLSLDNYNISSFNYKALLGARSISKEVKLSYLTLRPDLKKWDQLNRKLKGLYSVNPLFLLLRKKHIKKMHKEGIQIHPWTVNRDRWIRRMLKIGVDAIITDHPQRVKLQAQSMEVSRS